MKLIKKLLVVFLLITMLSVNSVVANANEEIAPCYEIASSTKSSLSISSGTAYCYSSVKCHESGYICITQTLEQMKGSSWYPVKDASWTNAANSQSLIANNSKSNLSDGTYRLKTVYTLTSDGTTETITSYCES